MADLTERGRKPLSGSTRMRESRRAQHHEYLVMVDTLLTTAAIPRTITHIRMH